MVSIGIISATLFIISLVAVSGLPIPDTTASSGSGSTEIEQLQPHRLARAFSCEEPEPSTEEKLRNLGFLDTGLNVLHTISNRLNGEWPLTQSEACRSPVNHTLAREAYSLSPLAIKPQDLANWAGVFEAYGEVIQLIIARGIPKEQSKQLESLYDVVSAVLMDYKNVLQPLHCKCGCDCFQVPSVAINIPEHCSSLAELVVSDLNIRDVTAANRVRLFWLINQFQAYKQSGVTGVRQMYDPPTETEWTNAHSLSFS